MKKFIITKKRLENYKKYYKTFAECPNSAYKPLRCPFSLQGVALPIPCWGNFKQCAEYRKNTRLIQNKGE